MFSITDKFAFYAEIIVRARPLAFEVANAYGSRLEQKAHNVLRKNTLLSAPKS